MSEFFQIIETLNLELNNISNVIIRKFLKTTVDIEAKEIHSNLFNYDLAIKKEFQKNSDIIIFENKDLSESCLICKILSHLNTNNNSAKKLKWCYLTNFFDKSYIKMV